jgi:hypothetical protein
VLALPDGRAAAASQGDSAAGWQPRPVRGAREDATRAAQASSAAGLLRHSASVPAYLLAVGVPALVHLIHLRPRASIRPGRG